MSLLVRPENIQLEVEQKPNAVQGTIRGITYLGGSTEYVVAVGTDILRARAIGSPRFALGQPVYVTITKSIVLTH